MVNIIYTERVISVNNDRCEKILEILEAKGEVHLKKLKELFPNVSEMTIRRDLVSLERAGYLVRTYGGAVSTRKLVDAKGEEDAYSKRAVENVEAKMYIASKALDFMEQGRSVYLDAGSTIMCLAKMLPDENYSIITSGVNIALVILKKNLPSVAVPGGFLNRNTVSMSGPYAVNFIDKINIDVAFMSASGFSVDSGFTVSNMYEAELKRKVVERARRVIMLVDSSKINKNLPFTYARLEDINVWICEKGPSPELAEELRKHNIDFIY